MKKYIVIWFKNQRLGSVELNDSNIEYLTKRFTFNVLQVDVTTGTEHWECTGRKK
jgi:hypothetical protein